MKGTKIICFMTNFEQNYLPVVPLNRPDKELHAYTLCMNLVKKRFLLQILQIILFFSYDISLITQEAIN